MPYETVFDVARDGFGAWWFSATGLVGIAVGIGMFVYLYRHPDPRRGKYQPAFAVLIASYSAWWTITSFASTHGEYARMRDALRAGNFVVVEGVVQNYKPASPEGHANEQFDVAGHQYSFSDYEVIAGYHKSRSHGGVIHEGLQVRIAEIGGQIARLEIQRNEGSAPAP